MNDITISKMYDTEYLINRAYGTINIDNSRSSVQIPIIENVNRKCYIRNFYEMSKSINRNTQELQMFFQNETGLSTSITGDKHLKFEKSIKDKRKLIKFFKYYIKEYVACKSCKSIKTDVTKINRIKYLSCNNCKCKIAI